MIPERLWMFLLPAVIGYFLGAIPSALWIGRGLTGVDVRREGSGNLGATNVYRVLGPRIAALVLAADMAKGVAAVLFPYPVDKGLDFVPGAASVRSLQPLIGGLFAIVGHMWTCFASFRGGKGVATGAGVFFALAPLAMLLDLGVWIAVFALTRTVSIASIAAALALLPALLWTGIRARPAGSAILGLAGVVALLILVRHGSNIGRILRGQEKALTRGGMHH